MLLHPRTLRPDHQIHQLPQTLRDPRRTIRVWIRMEPRFIPDLSIKYEHLTANSMLKLTVRGINMPLSPLVLIPIRAPIQESIRFNSNMPLDRTIRMILPRRMDGQSQHQDPVLLTHHPIINR